MSVKIVNRMPEFISSLKSGVNRSLNETGILVKRNMDNEVPVDTGNLKAHNSYKVSTNSIIFENNCEYAGYQEFGTRKQKGKPFFRKAVENHITAISNIFERNIPK